MGETLIHKMWIKVIFFEPLPYTCLARCGQSFAIRAPEILANFFAFSWITKNTVLCVAQDSYQFSLMKITQQNSRFCYLSFSALPWITNEIYVHWIWMFVKITILSLYIIQLYICSSNRLRAILLFPKPWNAQNPAYLRPIKLSNVRIISPNSTTVYILGNPAGSIS